MRRKLRADKSNELQTHDTTHVTSVGLSNWYDNGVVRSQLITESFKSEDSFVNDASLTDMQGCILKLFISIDEIYLLFAMNLIHQPTILFSRYLIMYVYLTTKIYLFIQFVLFLVYTPLKTQQSSGVVRYYLARKRWNVEEKRGHRTVAL